MMLRGYLKDDRNTSKSSFKPKSLAGYRRDLKFVCAKIGRMDLYERAQKIPCGVKMLRSMISATQRSPEALENYLKAAEAGRSKTRRDWASLAVVQRERMLLRRDFKVAHKRANSKLALDDPCAHLGDD